MTPMQAWRVISANLAELYKRRKSDAYEGHTDGDVEAEVIAFKALREMEARIRNGDER
jgi:hypothetical protein